MPSEKNKLPSRSSPGQPPVPEGPLPESSANTSALRTKFDSEKTSTSLSEKPSPQPGAAPETAAPPSAAQSEVQRRVRLQEAFRERGLDERNLAGQFAGVMEKLGGDEGNPKSHLDGLKEWIRVLADKATSADEAPVMFQLIHSIPRPVREKPAVPSKAPGDKEDSES